MSLKSRLRHVAANAQQQLGQRLIDERLGGCMIVALIGRDQELFQAINGKVYTAAELDDVARRLYEHGITTPILVDDLP